MTTKYLLLFGLIASVFIQSKASWSDPSGTQYHIQTDEGPERYFKYQTDNGQYRKEKRLQDGTVIGTNAWIDAAGMLRQDDYVADNQGYRIVKTKNVYVGVGRRIDDAMKYAKSAPSNANSLVPATPRFSQIVATTPKPIVTTYKPLSPFSGSIVKNVIIRPHSEPSQLYSTPDQRYVKPYSIDTSYIPPSAINNALVNSAEVVKPPSPIFELPELSYVDETRDVLKKIQPVAVINSTPAPIGVSSTTLSPVISSTPAPVLASPAPRLGTPKPYYSKDFHSYAPYFSSNQIESRYDGVSLTNSDGFRYYLPRQYHEEVGSGGQERDGSFGYIDPFGIRRVIYYNARPGRGFVHRKNNRYVGFNSTPYDPRPAK